MINISINLLPPDKKKKLKFITNFIFSKVILELIIFASCLISIILIWTWVILQESFADLASASSSINREYLIYNKEIKKINQMVKNIDKSSDGFQVASPKIIELSKNLPTGIKLNSVYIDYQNQTLSIEGTSKTRDGLLNYQQILRDTEWIGQVDTPVSKLFQKTDINFEFKTKLKNTAKTK
ncbi:MAG: hypothetical protein ABIH87_00560 [bacterium]